MIKKVNKKVKDKFINDLVEDIMNVALINRIEIKTMGSCLPDGFISINACYVIAKEIVDNYA